MDKNVLREKYKIIRNNVQDKEIKSNIIFKKIIKNKLYEEANVIALYSSFNNEVDTHKIIEYSLKIGKVIVLPKVVEKHKLDFFKIIDENNNLIKNKFGILEPISNKVFFTPKENIDLFIVPGICFDNNKNRVGYGKGFYDYYLENVQSKKLGICFDEQITEDFIDSNEFDVKMDFIITDRKEF